MDTARSVTEIPEETSVVTAPITDHSERTDHSPRRHGHSEVSSRRQLPSTETEDYSDHSSRSLRSYSDYSDTSTVSKQDRKTRSVLNSNSGFGFTDCLGHNGIGHQCL